MEDTVDRIVGSHWPNLEDVAVAAVGGYGRGELFPFSDIDLLLVSDRTDLQEPLAPFLRGLWDSGLRVSHSVRSLGDCLHVDKSNVELSVSLLDRRFLLGDRTLFDQLRDPPGEHLAPALAKLTRERHARYDNTIYHLEPNLKDAPGGLRDLQVVRWLAQLNQAQISVPPHDFLFRLRVFLHTQARRDQNVLTHAMQETAAQQFGYTGTARLMRDYYRESKPIHRACLRSIEAEETHYSPLFARFRDRTARLSNADVSVVRGRVYLRMPIGDSALPCRVFEFVARHGIPLAPDTEDRLANAPDVTFSWRNWERIAKLPHANLAVRAMHDTGLLVQVFPALAAIESLVIQDFYHRYTVDEHTLVSIDAAVDLRRRCGDRFGDLARETTAYPALLAALLFHDVGKGSGTEDHACASSLQAAEALRAISMPTGEMQSIVFLIEQHLAMSRLMLTRDLEDPSTAQSLAALVGTVEQLKLLTLLTYCDISAVHPGALTPWRSILLWKLYAKTERHLTQGLEAEPASRYLLTHSAEEIAGHRAMESLGVALKLERFESVYRLTIVARDRARLFAAIAGTLASFGMNILRAEAFANEREFFIITVAFADPLRALALNPSEYRRLEMLVRAAVEGRANVETLLRGRPPAKPAGEIPQVTVDNEASPRATLLQITAGDRPGLLYEVSRAIAAAGCNIEVLLVDTEGRKAIDVFYLTRDGAPLSTDIAIGLKSELTGILMPY